MLQLNQHLHQRAKVCIIPPSPILDSRSSLSRRESKPQNSPSTPTPLTGYLKGYPLCRKPGFTEVGNFYVESTHSYNSSTRKCLNDCRRNATVTFINALFGKTHKQPDGSWGGCGSISFAKRYGLCNFYDKSVENTQLIYDNTSNFVHYDLFCAEGLFGNKGLFGWF